MNLLTTIPTELNCQIFRYMKDITSIVTYMRSSPDLLNAAKYCITELTSPDLVQVSVAEFSNFTRLTDVGNNILLTGPFDVISTIPKLNHATFYFEGPNFTNVILLILQYLNSKQKVLNIRIINNFHPFKGFILQDNRFMVYGFGSWVRFNLDNDSIRMIQAYDPSLIYIPTVDFMLSEPEEKQRINYVDIYECYSVYFVMKKSIKDFLSNADFGLLHPNELPSEDNIPLSEYAKLFANFGVDNNGDEESVTLKFLEIYFIYHQITDYQAVAAYFQPDPNEYAKILDAYNIDVVSNLDDAWTVIRKSVFININEMTLQNFIEIDLPKADQPMQSCTVILDILDEVLNRYQAIYDTNKVFYETNGNTKYMTHNDRFVYY